MTDEELIERLRAVCTCNIDSTPCMAEDDCRDALAAADRIEALVKERDEARSAWELEAATVKRFAERHERNLVLGAETRARAERLEAAMIQMRDDKTGFRHAVHFRRFITAAMKGDDHE